MFTLYKANVIKVFFIDGFINKRRLAEILFMIKRFVFTKYLLYCFY